MTDDDLRQMAVMWLAQGRPAPTAEEMPASSTRRSAEEILSREAVDLGLDRDDEIIKRRLAQKMDFLLADLAAIAPPTTRNSEPGSPRTARASRCRRISAFATSISRSTGTATATRDAAAAASARSPAFRRTRRNWPPSPIPSCSGTTTAMPRRTRWPRSSGPASPTSLFQLRPGSWQGPIQSGYGWHLIWVNSYERGRIPSFEEVEPMPEAAWLDDRYREIKRRAFDEMRSRYTVIVPPIEDVDPPEFLRPAPGQARRGGGMSSAASRLAVWLVACFSLMAALAGIGIAAAHEIGPPTCRSTRSAPSATTCCGGRRCSRASGCRWRSVFPDSVTNVAEPAERVISDSVIERRVIDAPGGLAGKRIEIVGLQATITDVLVRTVCWMGPIRPFLSGRRGRGSTFRRRRACSMSPSPMCGKASSTSFLASIICCSSPP